MEVSQGTLEEIKIRINELNILGFPYKIFSMGYLWRETKL